MGTGEASVMRRAAIAYSRDGFRPIALLRLTVAAYDND